jgi:transposase InsO family protein
MPNSRGPEGAVRFGRSEGTEAYWRIPFDRLCDALGIGHRLTKSNHPWTNGQVERMNLTIKDATVKLTTTRHTII